MTQPAELAARLDLSAAVDLEPYRTPTADLEAVDPGDVGPYGGVGGKKAAKRDLKRLVAHLAERQRLFYADGRFALLLVLQAMDAGGKDGTIRRALSGLNPQGVHVTSFKAPSDAELAHDFLWRVHARTPRRGQIGVFNRSHYEDVLVARVAELVPEATWRARYAHIVAFEALLRDAGTSLLKVYLHVGHDEQAKRLRKRLEDPERHWKFDAADLAARDQWDAYRAAYAEAFARCGPAEAPWLIVPADRKWYRNLAISQILVDTLESLDMAYPPPEDDLDDVEVV